MTILQHTSRRVVAQVLRRNTVNNITRRTMMAFEDHARLRGKFEEDRIAKEQEETYREMLRSQQAQEDVVRRQKYHDNIVEPVKKDFAALLAKTGDSISDQGLENLAKSRLGD